MDHKEKIRPLILKQLIIFILMWLGFTVIGYIIMGALANALGIHDLKYLFEEMQKGNFLDQINSIKILSGVAHVFSYLVPALFFATYVYKKQAYKFLYLDKPPKLLNIPLTLAIVVLVFPLVSIIYYINMQLVPSGWIAEETLELQKLLLKMNTPTDLILNLVVVGLIAGIGEELVFRGVLQRLFSEYSNNRIIGIWVAAILFSMIHFQPEGFVPRALLGALFGYMLIWTGNLWVPILGHITFNSSQVLVQYVMLQSEKDMSLEELEYFPIVPTIISTIITVVLVLILIRINKDNAIRLTDKDIS
ncbi:MAG: CPBP family intramembrane metalloprotease [Aureispira sp.]|nr:CPBP family intramembrane metalloprotease [Aureispira sp.]